MFMHAARPAMSKGHGRGVARLTMLVVAESLSVWAMYLKPTLTLVV